MDNIREFKDFLTEAQFNLSNPASDGETLAGVILANRNAKEQPKGSNTGTEVNNYLKSVGLKPGLPWCAAFVYYIFDQLAKRLKQPNPLPKTGGVMNHWNSAPADVKIPIANARANHNLVRPGQIFIMSRPGKGLGHTGIVMSVNPAKGTFTSIEGNTNDRLSGEGDRVGVNTRAINSNALIGFIDYFKGKRTAEFENDLQKAIDSRASSLSPLEAIPGDDVVGGGPIGSAPDEYAKSQPGDEIQDRGFAGTFIRGISSFAGKNAKDLTVGQVRDLVSKLK